MYSLNQNDEYYAHQGEYFNFSKNTDQNSYYNCGNEIWMGDYVYMHQTYDYAQNIMPTSSSFPNINDQVQALNKSKKHYLDNDEVDQRKKHLKMTQTKKINNSSMHDCSISSCHSPTASVTSSSNSSSNDELVYESLFKAYQNGSLSKSKYRRLMANERERKRMHGLNSAFENLRAVLPSLGSNKQFSKYET